jgi:acetylglutamate/LysW-gamma-L-alpha-aminoadipate kinase
VPGVLADFPDEDSLIAAITSDEIENIAQTAAQGRMRIKLLAAQEALDGGVEQVVLGDARSPTPITHALAGAGTIIY